MNGDTTAAFDEGEITQARRVELGNGLYTTAPAFVAPFERGVAQDGLEDRTRQPFAPVDGSRESGLDPVLAAAATSPPPAQSRQVQQKMQATTQCACRGFRWWSASLVY